jgi:phosphoglycerate dehydrogenase-like enzyme
MVINIQNTIICDWVDEVSHYDLPEPLLKAISTRCEYYGVNLEMDGKVADSVRHDVIACIGNRFDARLLEKLPNVKWVQFGSVGTDKIPPEFAYERDIIITNARGIFESAVARHTYWLIINSLQKQIDYNCQFNRRQWESTNKISLNSLTFLILGTGPIAQKLKSILKSCGFKSLLVAREEHIGLSDDVISHRDLQKINKETIAVVNLLPANNNEQFVDKDYLSVFKDMYLYVNVGRIETENHDQIVEMLKMNEIKNAAWDVIKDPKKASLLINEFGDRVILTPHVASFNSNHWPALAELTLHNISAFLSGETNKLRNYCYG